MDSLRETLRVFAEAKKGSTGWQDISLQSGQVRECLQLLVLESSQWVERFDLPSSSPPSPILQSQKLSKRREDPWVGGLVPSILLPSDLSEVEESLWLALSDASGWILKASPTPQTAISFSEEMLPFLLVSHSLSSLPPLC